MNNAIKKYTEKQECYQDLEDSVMEEKLLVEKHNNIELLFEIERLMGTTPNDQELGEQIRKLFN